MEKQDIYLWGSGIFARKKQVAFNGGFIFAKVKTLSSSVKQDEEGAYVLSTISEVPTYEKVQIGWYLGVTYNLIRTKKN